MSSRCNELKELNRSLERRVETTTRSAEKNQIAIADVTERLEECQKRTNGELRKLEEDMEHAIAERDAYRSHLKLRDMEIAWIRRRRVDVEDGNVADKSPFSRAIAANSRILRDNGKENRRSHKLVCVLLHHCPSVFKPDPIAFIDGKSRASPRSIRIGSLASRRLLEPMRRRLQRLVERMPDGCCP
jgi:hypothetical protein